MIIGIDASRANQTNRTGTEWYSYHLIQHIAKLDTAQQFLLYVKNELRDDLKNLGENFNHEILNWPPKKLWTQCRLSFEMFKNPCDTLFVPAHTIPLIHPRKTVTTCHDIGFENFPELYSAKEIYYHRYSMKLAAKKAAHIITISDFSRNQMIERFNIPSNKITRIYLSYDHERFKVDLNHENLNQILDSYGLIQNNQICPYFFYVGRLESKKNIVNLIKAFGLLKREKGIPHKLFLAGFPGTGFDKIKIEIENLNQFKKDLIIPGWIPQSDLAFLMNGAEVFTFPSLYEGFGIPVLEAFASGTPVCASNITSIPEIARDAASLFDPNNFEDMANKLDQIIHDDYYKNKLIQKGINRCSDFSWDKCSKETLNILQNI